MQLSVDVSRRSSVRRHPIRPNLLTFLLPSLILGSAASAQTFTWVGGDINNNWNSPKNWSGNVIPPTSGLTTTNLVFAGSLRTTPSMQAAYSVNSISFATNAASFTLSSGSTLTLGAGGITNNSTATQTLSLSINTSNSQTWSATSGNLAFTSAINILSGTLTLNAAAGQTISVSGGIGGAGSLSFTGSGTTILSSNIKPNGPVLINGSNVIVNAAGSISLVSGGITLAGNSSLTLASGTVAMTGGDTRIGTDSGDNAILTVNGGSYSTNNLTVSSDGLASVSHTGGTVSISGNLSLGSAIGQRGTYSISSGQLTSNYLLIGEQGQGAFDQTGGNVFAGDTFAVSWSSGSSGSYSMSGGSMTTTYLSIGSGGPATVTQTGGTISAFVLQLVAPAGLTNTYTLSNGSLSVNTASIAASASARASILQSGGTFTATGSLNIGDELAQQSNYTLSGGLLQTSNTAAGASGIGTFTHTGGTHNTDYLTIGAIGTGTYTQSAGALTAATQITIASSSSAIGTLNFSGGTITTPLLRVGYGGNATASQTGGTLTLSTNPSVSTSGSLVLGNDSGSRGEYTLSAGSINTKDIYVGVYGTGIFNQLGGSVTASGTLLLGNPSNGSNSYTISSGSLSANALNIGAGGTGTFTQSGGVTNASSIVSIGLASGVNTGYGILNVSAGTINTPGLEVSRSGRGGAVVQTGGTINVGTLLQIAANGSVASTTYSLSGGNINTFNFLVGNSGSGTFAQSGGVVTVTNNLVISNGGNVGSNYLMSGGSLLANKVELGARSPGTFTQTGGTVTITGSLGLSTSSLGEIPGIGSYRLSNGNLNATTTVLGQVGSASFLQTGGNFSTQSMSLSSPIGQSATYTLSGGTLSIGSLISNSNPNNLFTFSGGILKSPSDTAGTTTFSFSPIISSSGLVIDSGPGLFTINGTMVADPALTTPLATITKVGSGTLSLTGTQLYNGPTTISGGTLLAGIDASLGTSPLVNLNPGTRLNFANSTTTSRTFNLLSATLGPSAGVTLTYSGATVNGGFLSSTGVHELGNQSLLAGTTSLVNSTLSQTSGTATINLSSIRGKLNQSAGATLNLIDTNLDPSSITTLSGLTNTTGVTVYGQLNIMSGGTLNNTSTPLYLASGSRTTLSAGSTLTAASNAPIELSGLLINNGSQSGPLNILYGGTAKGAGSFGSISIADGGTFSPGNSPAAVLTADSVWDDAGTYILEMADASGEPGAAYDFWSIDGSLSITSGSTPNSRFIVKLVSLAADLSPGPASNFSPAIPRSWEILSTTDSISGFTPNTITLDTSGFANPHAGTFSLSSNGSSLFLNYTPGVIPEPSALSLLLLPALPLRRRR